jgi:hypothetical protein
MTGKADNSHEADKPKESQPAPEAAQKSGIVTDPYKLAELKATQQERIRAQGHSATDLYNDKDKPQPKKTKFELVDDGAAKPGATHAAVPTGHPTDWLVAGRNLAALPFEQQAQIIGIGLMAGIEQYNRERLERNWGALIGTVQGIGDTAVNLGKIADFSAYCITGDKARAGKMGAEFGKSVGQSIISGVNIFEGAKEYGEHIQKTGDVGKPIRDVIAVGQILDRQWEKLSPREQERQKYELIGQLVSDAFIGPPGAKAIGKATKFTEVLGCISKAATEHGGHTVDEIRKAVNKISDVVRDLMAPEFVLEGGIKVKASQLRKSELNVLKSLGQVSEHTPETRPLFTNADGTRLYRDHEIEALGGEHTLEKLTPEQLKSKDVKRYELPKIEVSSFGVTFSASIPGKFSMLNGDIEEKGVVDVINIRKGLMPEGAGAHFVAETLKAIDAIPTKEFSYSLISNPETQLAFANHLPPEQSLLGKHMIKVLKEFGLRVESAQWVSERDSLSIVLNVKR